MPLYYFHVDVGLPHGNFTKIDLPDLDAARRQAATYFSALIQDDGAAPGAGEIWQLRVTDEVGILFFSLQFASIRRAAIEPNTPRVLTRQGHPSAERIGAR